MALAGQDVSAILKPDAVVPVTTLPNLPAAAKSAFETEPRLMVSDVTELPFCTAPLTLHVESETAPDTPMLASPAWATLNNSAVSRPTNK
ncbi:MAG: hypothetical protein E6Q48_03500 [Limnohabitans sp.]|nr:MAG: hypothetical protein E6Q48_03500 [Limnohabitans sp.]